MIGGPRRGRAIVAALCLAIAMVGLIVIPYATGRGMNVIAENGSKSDLTQWAIVGAVAGAVYLLFSYVANRLFSKLAVGGVVRPPDRPVRQRPDAVDGVLLQELAR